MTTQNTYDDHHDADASVVGHPYASETSGAQEVPEASTTSTPAEEHHAAHDNPEEPTSTDTVVAQQHDAPHASVAQEEVPSTSETAATQTEEAPTAPAISALAEEHHENHAHNAEVPQPQSETSVVDEPVAVEPILVEDAQAVPLPEFATSSEITDHSVTEQHEAPQFSGTNETHEVLPSQEAQAFQPSQLSQEAHEEPKAATQETQPTLDTTLADEEVRPFTSFFEEFRQAEEARQELQAEALSLFATAQAADYPPLLADNVNEHAIADVVASAGTIDATETSPTEEVFGTTIEAIPIGDTASATTASNEQAQEQAAQAQAIPTPPKERPVSPLLRPARPRFPRHGIIRHREEPVQPEASAVTPAAEPTKVEESVSSVAEQPAPRPTRRYRFDNRATAKAAATAQTATPPRIEGNRNVLAAKTENGQNGNSSPETTVKHGSNTSNDNGTSVQSAQAAEGQTAKQPVAQDSAATENTANVAAAPSHISEQDRRRRHGQERPREKEQTMIPATPVANAPEATLNQATTPVSTTVADIAALIAPEQPTTEIAPEDLPPLEYSELQKANPRRRRRHRTTTNGTPATPVAAIQPPSAQTPPAATPAPQQASIPAPEPQPQATKLAPVAEATNGQVLPPVTTSAAPRTIGNPQQYSIVSGYTVNQMNQGNEASGPFMGPEPSPARGSIITRDGRTARAESQRSHVYPVRPTTDATVSSGSVHQLASVLSQAIQTQTDRMVAELRRANQGPTNVSVSLPPMPSTERVGVFVDVANLLYSARTTRVAVDFGKLLDFLRGNRRLIRAHAYCPTSPQAGDEQMFLQAVKGLGYRITTKNYKTFSSGAKKADLDLDLCMDVVRLVDGGAVDCIVLVSGDSDFMPMLDYCSDHGVRVEVAAFDEAMSATLRQSCDLFINLSMLEEIRS